MEEKKKFYLTKKGLKGLKKEYETLKNLRVAKTKGEAPKIWESEDLNPEYLSFQEDLNFLDTRIAELESIFKNACLIKRPLKKELDIISLGSTIKVKVGEDKDEFTSVGTIEVTPC